MLIVPKTTFSTLSICEFVLVAITGNSSNSKKKNHDKNILATAYTDNKGIHSLTLLSPYLRALFKRQTGQGMTIRKREYECLRFACEMKIVV